MDISRLIEAFEDTPLSSWLAEQPAVIEAFLHNPRHGDMPRWRDALAQLPEIDACEFDLSQAAIFATCPGFNAEHKQQCHDAFKQLMPWRKGPYNIAGTYIDTEWRSDYKWQRVLPHIQSLRDRLVLDVGCGNGYHIWRMLEQKPRAVMGIDPSPLFVMQFEAIKRFIGDVPASVLPFGIQALPENPQSFDTVFSMGVLYHRRSAIDHLIQLKTCLRPGGELVLETLVIEGDEQQVLVPVDRYAKMRNVWFIPSVAALLLWMRRCGFVNVHCVDINQTSTDEQRSTDWMPFESLQDYLHPDDKRLSIEGYPAPKRAVIVAQRPE